MTITDSYTLERLLLNDTELDALHRSENLTCIREFPDNPFSSSHPLTALHEVHRREWEYRQEERKSIEASDSRRAAREAAATAKEAEKEFKAHQQEKKSSAVVAPRPRACLDCGGDILPTGKRGRPPVRCAPCKTKFDEITATADKSCGACATGKGRHLNTCLKSKASTPVDAPTPKRTLRRTAK